MPPACLTVKRRSLLACQTAARDAKRTRSPDIPQSRHHARPEFLQGRIGVYTHKRVQTLSGTPMPNDTTRWTVSVSKETDIAVRSFLAQRGLKKGDLSKFIEEAVRWRVLDQTITEVRNKFADLPSEELESLIDEAVSAVRQADTPRAG